VQAEGDRLALWKMVHDKCVPGQTDKNDPSLCLHIAVDRGPERGYAILKDRVGATQLLLIPMRPIAGIESAFLLDPDAPNYFGAAWDARTYLFRLAGKELPRNALSLAINSAFARSQDQLHIHIDCVRREVRDLLAQHAAEIGQKWSPLAFDLVGRRYQAMRVEKSDLGDDNPFRLLAVGIPAAGADMGKQTLVVVGASFGPGRDGFILLADRADPGTGGTGHGEDLQDHSCAVARESR
jgi:CDP-diacylglycerol pyrophosphatase